ncbi:MAG: hypothetical protein D6722_18445, partial [Bacteroidetes bacterium]
PLLQPDLWKVKVGGSLEQVAFKSILFAKPVQLLEGRYVLQNDQKRQLLQLHEVRAQVLDSPMELSGRVDNILAGITGCELKLAGRLQPRFLDRLTELLDWDPKYHIKPGVQVSAGNLSWRRGKEARLTAQLMWSKGPKIQCEYVFANGQTQLRRTNIIHDGRKAAFSLVSSQKQLHLIFDGELNTDTLDAILVHNPVDSGWVKGNLQLQLAWSRPLSFTGQGHLQAKHFRLPWKGLAALEIDQLDLTAQDAQVKLTHAVLRHGEDAFSVSGTAIERQGLIELDMEIDAERLRWDKLAGLLQQLAPSRASADDNRAELPISGNIQLHSRTFRLNGMALSELRSTLQFSPQGLSAQVRQARL